MDDEYAQRLVRRFIASLSLEKGLADNTQTAYQHDINSLIEFNKDRSIKKFEDIKTTDISDYIAKLYQIGISPATINRQISAFRGFFRFLMIEGLLRSNPARLVLTPKTGRKLPEILNVKQIEKLLKSIDRLEPAGIRDYAIIEMLYGCGLRVSELINLRLDSILEEGNMLRVLGKGNKQRFVPIGECAKEALKTYIENVRSGLIREGKKAKNVIFLSLGQGAPLTRQAVWQMVKRNASKAGLTNKVTTHTLRHSFATHLLEGGAGLRDVQELLGHSSIETTNIYTHIDRSHLLEVVRQFHPQEKKYSDRIRS